MTNDSKNSRTPQTKRAKKKTPRRRWPKSGLGKFSSDLVAYRLAGKSLRAIQKELLQTHGVHVAHTTIARFFQKLFLD